MALPTSRQMATTIGSCSGWCIIDSITDFSQQNPCWGITTKVGIALASFGALLYGDQTQNLEIKWGGFSVFATVLIEEATALARVHYLVKNYISRHGFPLMHLPRS